MKRGSVRWRSRVVAVAFGVAVACAPVAQPLVSTAPANTCPDHPCAAYAQEDAGVACANGVCIDTLPAPRNHLVLLVAVPTDARVAPGLTFAVSIPDDSGTAFLPSTLNFGRYVVSSQTLEVLHADLANGPLCLMTGACDTPLPVRATYRPLWYLGSSSPAEPMDAGAPVVDAVTMGLALYPIAEDAVPPRYPTIKGPAGGPDVAFEAYVQAGVTYERTLAPAPPFDQTFPPDINRIKFSPGEVLEMPPDDVYGPDRTRKMSPVATFPTFDLSRADGQSLDGWTAYLRDRTTKRPISPIKSLSGTSTPDGGLLLPTSHHPPPDSNGLSDALTNTELVMAPPAQLHMPTAILQTSQPQLARAQSYALVPPSVTLDEAGIAWSDQSPVSAEVVFEATGIYDIVPARGPDPSDAGAAEESGAGGRGDAGRQYLLQREGFEYVARAIAQPDPSGMSTYSIELPRGEYRVSVRPLDEANAITGGLDAGGSADTGAPLSHALTIQTFDTETNSGTRGPNITIDSAPIVYGTAVVADHRSLSGATVEAMPIHCASPVATDAGISLPDSPACMPRYAQTRTADSNGATFMLALDPGLYALRVEPADGTRLPWVSQTVTVPTSNPVAFTIPAPVHRELRLLDGQDGQPVANAIVRMFTVPASGPAIEVGRSLTDATGHFDMYLDPAVQ